MKLLLLILLMCGAEASTKCINRVTHNGCNICTSQMCPDGNLADGRQKWSFGPDVCTALQCSNVKFMAETPISYSIPVNISGSINVRGLSKYIKSLIAPKDACINMIDDKTGDRYCIQYLGNSKK